MKVRILAILSFLMLNAWFCIGQTVGSSVPRLPVDRVISRADEKSSELIVPGPKLFILDFFGTWCVPCIRALPKLDSLQGSFKEQIKVWLISTESTEKLTSFLEKRPSLHLPIVVDSNAKLSNYFQPPSYPYTVIINPQGVIVSITHASALTKDLIESLIKNEEPAPPIEQPTTSFPSFSSLMINTNTSNNILVKKSQELVYATKTEESSEALEMDLSKISASELEKYLITDSEKKAFWLNIYNAFTQIQLKKDTSAYLHRNKFFKTRFINIGERKWSLDEIEHGLLRKSSCKYSLGYLKKIGVKKFEKKNRVAIIDPRIHFALNCGANSCPPIAFYNDATIDQQLEVATTNYLNSEASYNAATNVLTLPALMSWFRGDFGKKKERLKYAQKIGLLPDTVKPKIHYKKYDWSLQLNHFQK
ncbi:MAG: DUF547 domain-containing protein [Chitinophagaceae bacterium]|uniref:DUF547 domain-containing protein n=1 Tax=unclassified Paraflavitalea TaxID=2798305 RepID=UPI003D34D97D|nr:DUF547 domain-containing protein [Chitinophagaceae bacterium]